MGVDLCVSASLEFDLVPSAVMATVMQQGEIYGSAEVVVGKRRAVSPLQGDTGDCLASQTEQVCRLSLNAAVAYCGHAFK